MIVQDLQYWNDIKALSFYDKQELKEALEELILDEKVAATVEEQLPDAIQAALDKYNL